MTKQIEDTLNLPSLEDILGEDAVLPETEAMLDDIAVELANSDYDIEKSLIDPDGSREHAQEMDHIHDSAIRAHKDLMDMAFNMEPKNAGTIFEPAARMLEIALKASQNKTDARMKSIKLKIEKEKHDHEMKKNQTDGVIEGEVPQQTESGYLADRNAVLRSLKEKQNKP